MKLYKYKKEYKRFRNNVLKTYFILDNLIYDITKNEDVKIKKVKNILLSLKHIKKKCAKLIDVVDSFDFENIKEKVKKKKQLDNLAVLPLYDDVDIYINPDYTISDMFKK